MKFYTGLILICTMFLSAGINAQKLENKTILTIDGVDYDAGTFMRFYFKNIDIVQDEDQKDVDNYLELYIDYRLKLQQAKKLGLHQKDSYLKQIASTRSSLAQNYLTDNEVTESLVQEAYDRSLQEVNASHILIKVSRPSAPADTLTAWNRIHAIYKELENGADFEKLARSKSEGPSAGNKGSLGWFGSFRMAYEFESAAYNTEKGNYSKPFRTDFGYHIVKVNDKRPNPGEVTVAHIMTFDKQGAQQKDAEARIKEIYDQLKSGKNFEKLAREFSDDVNSAPAGGRLSKFGSSGVDATFAKAAFELHKVGEYSRPIKTKYGWHIIKLLEKHPVKSFEKVQKELKSKIQNSARSRKITESFTSSLKRAYEMPDRLSLPETIYEMVPDSTFLKGTYVYIHDGDKKGEPLFNIKDATYYLTDFLEYIQTMQQKDRNVYPSKKDKLDAFYKQFVNDKLIGYYDKNLERDNQDFAFLFNEFKEGFLVFDLTESQIWEKAKNDTIGQKKYYDLHSDKYKWKRRLDIIITQSTYREVAEMVAALLKEKVSIDDIKSQLNVDNKTQVIISSGIVEENYNRLPENFEVKTGVSDIYHDDGDSFYKVIEVKEIMEPSLKSFKEASTGVISDYQQQLEKDWLENLRTGHQIKVHKKVLKKVKSQISKELGQ